MSVKPSNTALHLPELLVRGFRGIENLTIPRLGRVTLFAGKNGVGKTTLLEAVQTYAARGRPPVLARILQSREELADTVDEDGDETLAPNWKSLFYGRHGSSDTSISIGPKTEDRQVRIQIGTFSREQQDLFPPDNFLDEDRQSLRVEFQGINREFPMLSDARSSRYRRYFAAQSDLPPEIRCESSGPSLLSNVDLARFWDTVALTDYETRAVQTLNLLFDDRVERVAVIGDDRRSRPLYGRRVVVKIKGQDRPVPLKSLGDGAVRLFSVALALANSRDGFLVIDEAENGLHYAVQRDFWKMVLRTAHENNVQVFATTHSWDCVAGFAQAATDIDEVEGVLIRLERDGDQIRSIEYSESNLEAAAEYGIEVR